MSSTLRDNNKWLVMIYLAGDNNLSEECVFDLTEMKRADLPEDVVVVAALDSGIHDGTRVTIKKNSTPGKLREELEKSRKEEKDSEQAGSNEKASEQAGPNYSDKILNFIQACITQYKADRYALILSGHGSGSLGDFLSKAEADKIMSLSVPALSDLLLKVSQNEKLASGQLDILCLDACLMSMTEIAYAVRKYAKIMIGAEGFEPLAGWPYKDVLEQFIPVYKSEKELATHIVSTYINYYTDYQAAGISVDQAACDLTKIYDLSIAVKSLSKTLRPYLPKGDLTSKQRQVRNAIVLAHWEAQSYKNEQYTDLYDFCHLLKDNCEAQDVRMACQNVMNTIRGSQMEDKDANDAEARFKDVNGFVLKSCYSGLTVQYSRGVSIYFPWAENRAELEAYKKLEFAEESGWSDFLEDYLRVTKRDPRPGVRPERNFDQPFPPLTESGLVATSSLHRNSIENKNSSENKNSWENKNIGKGVGSMKNPPTTFFDCEDCSRNDR